MPVLIQLLKQRLHKPLLIVPTGGNQTLNQVPALGTKGMSDMTEVKNLQRDASDSERKHWKSMRCSHSLTQDLWLTPVGQVCIPDSLLPMLIDYLHSCTHLGKEGMVQLLLKTWWHPDLNTAAQMRLDRCLICMKNNKGKGIKCPPGTTPLPDGLFACIQLDFIELPKAQCYKYCLVMFDVISKWIEAFPTTNCTAHTVVKILLTEVIPRFVLPKMISSDNGPYSDQYGIMRSTLY